MAVFLLHRRPGGHIVLPLPWCEALVMLTKHKKKVYWKDEIPQQVLPKDKQKWECASCRFPKDSQFSYQLFMGNSHKAIQALVRILFWDINNRNKSKYTPGKHLANIFNE